MAKVSEETQIMAAKEMIQRVHFLEELDISDDYADLYYKVARYRGWQNLELFRDELEYIARNGCDVTKMFLENKMIGVNKLYRIVRYASKAKRADIYIKIRDNGMKASESEIDTMLMAEISPTLFNIG